MSAWRLFSASLCCSPASSLDEILRKSLPFIHFNFLPSPVAAYNSHEWRDLLRVGLFFFSWQTTFIGAVLPMGSHWHVSQGKDGGCGAVRKCSFVCQPSCRDIKLAEHPSPAVGASRFPPTCAMGKTPHGTCKSTQKSQGDLGVKAQTTASQSILEERHGTSLRKGSPPSTVRS